MSHTAEEARDRLGGPAPTAERRSERLRFDRRRAWPLGLVATVAVVPAALLAHSTLPLLNHPDEPENVLLGSRMVTDGSLTPGKYSYPSVVYDVIAIVVRLRVALLGPVDPLGISDSQNFGIAQTAYPSIYLLLRLVGVAAAVLLCIAVAASVRRITGRTAAAVGAGVLLALSPLTMENAVLVTPDIYSGLFTGLTLVGALALSRRSDLRPHLLTGAAAGLAIGSKYNAALVVLAVLAAYLLRTGRAWWRPAELARLAALGGTAAVAAILTTPALLIEPRAVWGGIRFEMKHYAAGQTGAEGDSLLFYARTLVTGNSLLVTAAVLGLATLLAWPTLRREVLVLLAFAVPYAALIGSQEVHFARNLMPLLPAVALLAGFGIASLLGLVERRGAPRPTVVVAGTAAGLVLAVLATLTFVSVRDSLDQPSRALARTWLQQNVPAGSRLVLESYSPYLQGYELVEVPLLHDKDVPPDVQAIVITERGGGRFLNDPDRYPQEVERYRELERIYCLGADFDDGPWIRILVPCAPGARPPGA